MSKKETTSLDYTNAITSAHVEDSKAFNVINVNTLIPPNHGKIVLEYIAGNVNGSGNIGTVTYFSKGQYQESKVTTRGDSLGTAHKVTLNFSNRTPLSLAGKSFVLYDDTGAVNVWFNVDFANAEPTNASTYRSIEVNLLSSQSSQIIAQKVALAMSMDSQFIGVHTLNYVIISSSTAGIKPDAYDVTTGIYIKNTAGIPPETLNNKYFLINSANNSTRYYVWYNVSGAGIDPLLAGKTGIMVPISSGFTAAQVAQKTKEILDANSDFITNINSETLFIRNKEVGSSDASEEGNSGFLVFEECQGQDRSVIATLILGYDSEDNLISVERI